jgi:hypothetical protein
MMIGDNLDPKKEKGEARVKGIGREMRAGRKGKGKRTQ